MIYWSKRFITSGYGLADASESLAHAYALSGATDHSVWDQAICAFADLHANHVLKRGRGPGSLEDEATAGLDYSVVTGNAIVQALPWFYSWYAAYVFDLWQSIASEPVSLYPDQDVSMNINIVAGIGGRYELHTDTSLSALLYLTSLQEEDGGKLELHLPDRTPITIRPQRGKLVLFDGTTVPHAVQPLRREVSRYSVPMAFVVPSLAARPSGLSAYLFSPEPGKD